MRKINIILKMGIVLFTSGMLGLFTVVGCGEKAPEPSTVEETSEPSKLSEPEETTEPSEFSEAEEVSEPSEYLEASEYSESEEGFAELSFEERADEIDRMIAEARQQYEEDDHSGLTEPVHYNVLWLGCEKVSYNGTLYEMSDFDKEYLEAVVLNFDRFLERITDHNLDIHVDFYYVNTEKTLTYDEDGDMLYLDRRSVQEEIDEYSAMKNYDSVLTTVRCDECILGLCTNGLEYVQGYSTFNLYEPRDGEYPLKDPEIPSLYATSVAVHEWMHQLEYMGTIVGVEYPSTHAYLGPDEYPGYKKYIADLNNYDYMEFYELVLQGKLPFTEGDTVRNVGMYPKMWKLTKRDVLNAGTFTIRNQSGAYLTAQEEEPHVTLSDTECRWDIMYGMDGYFCIIPHQDQNKRLDLTNAWDEEGNPVGLYWFNSWYPDAQRWALIENADGSYSIRTAYSSHRALSVNGIGEEAVICEEGGENSGDCEWFITRNE